MFIEKIRERRSGLLLYGITPPKAETLPEKIAQIAVRTINRIIPLDIDALIVYDVQDESARTAEERPFPFLKAHDPFDFARAYLNELELPKIIYRPAGKFSAEELTLWLSDLDRHRFYPVFVGVPALDFQVKTTLPEAYQLWSYHRDNSVMGAVTIPERHAALRDEDRRILDKAGRGVSYFVSQCIFNLDHAKQMVDDLCQTCRTEQVMPPTIIFTLTACGSVKTLHFMEWLGIHIPEALKEDLMTAEDMLGYSVQVCLEIARQLTDHCAERCIPFGFNIESVAIRKDEIAASIRMVEQVADMLYQKGLRKQPSTVGTETAQTVFTL